VSGGWEAGDNRVMLWDVATGQLDHTFSGHTDNVWYVASSPDGTELASASMDGTVRVWDLARRTECLTIRTDKEFLLWVDYSRDGRQLIGSDDHGRLRVWDRSTGTHLRMTQLDKPCVWQPALSPDGRYIAAGVEGAIVLLDFETLRIGRRLPCSITGRWDMWAAAFSRDGHLLAYCDDDRVQLMSLESGEPLGTLKHATRVGSVDFSPDGRTLATCDDANQVHVWDVEHRQE
jgi:WD40 repeat protein